MYNKECIDCRRDATVAPHRDPSSRSKEGITAGMRTAKESEERSLCMSNAIEYLEWLNCRRGVSHLVLVPSIPTIKRNSLDVCNYCESNCSLHSPPPLILKGKGSFWRTADWPKRAS